MIAVQLIPIQPKDKAFLRALYATTRYDIDLAPVSEQQKTLLKEQQFEAQHNHYQTHFGSASFDLVCIDERPVGRLYVDDREDEVRLIDIALLPEFRGRGIGQQLLTNCQERARQLGLPLRLRVEPDNPALRLYERLGFRLIADEQINLHLEWTPTAKFDEASSATGATND